MRTPFTIIAVLIVALLGLWALTEDDEGGAAAPAAAPVDVIAHRVEALRSLRFTRLPEPVTVTPQQAVDEGSPTSTASTRRSSAGPTRRSTGCWACSRPAMTCAR